MWTLWSYPRLPSATGEWLVIFALPFPIQLVLELAGEFLWNNRMTRYVDKRTAATSLSLVRIAYSLMLILAFMGLLFGAAYGWRGLEALIAM